MHSQKSKKSEEIMLHLTNPAHIAAKKHKFKLSEQQTATDFQAARHAYEMSDAGYYKATVNMFKLVYTEVRTNTPFFDTQKM